MAKFFQRLGLGRPELRAWALYDWANSVLFTTVLQIFPIYFRTVAAADLPPATASTRFALATSISVGMVALVSPVLGALADSRAAKKNFLGLFLGLGAAATAAMWLVGRGDWVLGAVLFILANFGVTASIVFYNALLPHIARPEEVDRVSTAGFALGYVGGGVLLAVNLLWIQKPQLFGFPDDVTAIRASLLSAAVWWVAFSLPLFRRVSEPASHAQVGEAGRGAVAIAFGRLARTLRDVRSHRDAFFLLLAFLVYNDGVNTVIRMATIYGTEIGIPRSSLIAAILLVQFVGVPFAFLFGAFAGHVGAKRAIFVALAVYVGIAVLAYRMRDAAGFFTVAVLVGMVQGGAQALARSLYATLIPRHKSGEMYGFFGVFDKFGGLMGSGLFALMITLTGSSRPAILALVVFFVVGALLLAQVDVARGQQAARAAEADAAAAPLPGS
jgi:UMF1 family MFS transporter